MTAPRRIGERSVATFLLALLAFSPPVLSIVNVEAYVFGIPLLYLYLFGAWGVIIALVAWNADLGARRGAAAQPIAPRAERSRTR